jgi:serine/threonine-protein phosphatase 5
MDKEEAYAHYKGLGNEAFKKQHFTDAIEQYTKAINLLETPDSDDLNDVNIISENVEDIRLHSHKHAHALAILYSNRAQTQLKLENYGLAISDCTISIDHDNKFVKSLYRRAVANYAIRELNIALKDCKEARILAPNDLKIKMLTNEISNELKRMRFEQAIDIVEKSVFSNINWDDLDLLNKELEIEINDKNDDVKIVNGLNDEFVERLIKNFLNEGKMNKHDAFAIVSAANTIFKNEKAMVEIGFNNNVENNENYYYLNENIKKITICGDTHGQYFDVINIFKKFGKVNNEHVYLFNGDFVDRGSWGCEVALLLYTLKVLYPNRIFINRGNHETDDMNLVYGFKDECKFKYGEKLFKCFSESFGSLPYCTLINQEYLVMHGGLFSDDNITLDSLRKINRFNHPHGQPPKTGIEMELLWTDPQIEKGRSLSKRGIGMQFGPDITKRFCETNKLKGIIRSHEVRQQGYEWEHDGMLCTVFSAPNYCDVQGNLGAVIHVDRNGELECCNFEAVPHPDIPPMKYTKNQYGF